MSDGYIGLDQQYDINLEVMEPPRQQEQPSQPVDGYADYYAFAKDKL